MEVKDRRYEGRPVQVNESVGTDGYRADGESDDDGKGRMRRATFNDLAAIMDINDNIYDGFDYMPTLFYTFMQSKLHFIYVYEQDGKLISLANYRLHPDRDDLISGMSARVRSSFEGRGLGTSSAFFELQKDYPALKRYVGDVLYTPKIMAKMPDVKVNYHWNILVYKLDDRQRLNRSTRIRQMVFDANRPFSLSYSIAAEWLERSDQLSRFLSKYVTDLFPCGTNWNPTPLNRSGLRHMVSSNKVYVTMDTSSTINSRSYDDLSGSRGERSRGQEGDLVGLSYSTACPCKYGIRIDIFFYGDNEQVLLSHFYSHLLHYINVTSEELRLGVDLNFPQTIDSKKIEELLREEMGERFQGIGATQAVQYIYGVERPRAKL